MFNRSFRRQPLFLLLISSAVLLASCALSPQQVNIKPDFTVATAPYSNGQAINVMAEDQRANPVIGMRGGVYDNTSTIVIGNDVKTEIAYAVAKGLSRWGFKPQVNANDQQITQMDVALTSLSYTPSNNLAAGKVKVVATFSVDVHKGSNSYHGSYEANSELGYVTVPSETRNNTQINEVIDMALQKIFEDQGLVKFLQE